MLILTRRIGETVCIGDDVQVTVLGMKGHQVRIGINAPKSTPVHREEVYERIKRDKEPARLETIGSDVTRREQTTVVAANPLQSRKMRLAR